jgi:parallel beta-helix repeat protein
MIITEDTQLAPGVYVLDSGISIGADGVTLEGEGATLVERRHEGAGIQARGRHSITIRGVSVSGFFHGVRLDDCQNATVEDVRVRDTGEIAGIDTFVYLWLPVEKAYGGAVMLNNVHGGAVRRCDLQHQTNGLLLYDCADLSIERNNASFNSGWGIYLSRSSNNVVKDNQLDFCNRVYRRPEDGTVRVEADAAAIVLVKGASRNAFLRNSCLCGGDGIFIAGYEHPGHVEPCNDNLFEENDCRLSPNNAIEATFSKGNVFRRNNCSRSNYGFGLGYSWENTLEDNVVEYNRFVGIAAEHAHEMVIRDNKISLNGEGVRLWTRGGAPLPYYPGFEVAYNVVLIQNLIKSNGIGFNGYTGDEITDHECHSFHLAANVIRDNRVGAQFKRVERCSVQGNTFADNVEAALRLEGAPDVRLDDNRFEDNRLDVEER